MKLLIENDKGNLLIEPPGFFPAFAIGTTVITDGEVEGVVVAINIDATDEEENITYAVQLSSGEIIEMDEDDIPRYYPSTNEFDLQFYINEGE